MYSGTGGQVDFVRAANNSDGGRAIIALPSRTAKGRSRIAATLQLGAGVVTPRPDARFVVTGTALNSGRPDVHLTPPGGGMVVRR